MFVSQSSFGILLGDVELPLAALRCLAAAAAVTNPDKTAGKPTDGGGKRPRFLPHWVILVDIQKCNRRLNKLQC